jgi:hypothetical protein
LRASVVAGTSFAGMSIQCPRCGGKAVYAPGASGEIDGDLIEVKLGRDGKSTTQISALEFSERPEEDVGEDPDAHQPTMRLAGMDPGPHHPATVTNPDATRRKRNREREGSTKTPPASPSQVFSADSGPIEEVGHAVTPVPVIDIGPPESDPVDTQVQEKPRAEQKSGPFPTDNFFTPDNQAAVKTQGLPPTKGIFEETMPDVHAYGKGAPKDKAWSASGIRRALSQSGIQDSGAVEALAPDGETHTFDKPPETPNVLIDISPGDSTAGRAGAEAAMHLLSDTEDSPEAVRSESSGAAGPSVDLGYRAWDSTEIEIESDLLLNYKRKSRRMTAILSLISVIVLGVLLGYVLHKAQQVAVEAAPSPLPALERPSTDSPAAERAAGRVLTLGLEPIDWDGPFFATSEIIEQAYPERIVARVTVGNVSSQDVSNLRVTASWHLLHDAPSVVHDPEVTLDREITAANPLRHNASIGVLVTFSSEFVPPGDPIESFIVISVAATADSDVFYRGTVAMIELEL